MPDFLTASSFDTLELPRDALGHQAFALGGLLWLADLPHGSVVALQGSRGRGRTDALARMMQLTLKAAAPSFWMNPWQYTGASLLAPVEHLVHAMAERAKEKGIDDARLQPALDRLLSPGQLAAPGTVAPSFRELAELLLGPEAGDRMLIVLIDDLDRCSPDRQVALLKTLRFLVAAGAPLSIVATWDPAIALEKPFDLRLNLPPVDSEALRALIRGQLERNIEMHKLERPRRTLREALPSGWTQLEVAAHGALVPSVRNPRLVNRVFDTIALLAAARRLPPLEQSGELRLVVQYLAIAERWPAVRRALVERGMSEGLDRVAAHCSEGGPRDPGLEDDPGLVELFSDLGTRLSSAKVVFPRIEEVLVGAGF